MMVLICDKGLSSLWVSFSSPGHLTCQNYFKQKWKIGSASHPRCSPYTMTHVLKHHQSCFHPANRSIPWGHVETLRIFHCLKLYCSANKQKVPLAELNVFLYLLIWVSEMQIYHQTTTEHKALHALNTNSEISNPFMHYALQKVVSTSCVYFVLRTVQWSPK